MNVEGLNHLTLATGDLERAMAFYVDLLGCVPHARWDRGVYLSAGDLWLCLACDTPRPARDYTHVAFSVAPADFGRWCERLDEANVVRWKSNTSEGDSVYVLDPDGHRLELHAGNLASRLAALRLHPYDGLELFDAPSRPEDAR